MWKGWVYIYCVCVMKRGVIDMINFFLKEKVVLLEAKKWGGEQDLSNGGETQTQTWEKSKTRIRTRAERMTK